MALELLHRETDPFQYIDCTGPFGAGDVYGGFCENGINYSESISLFESFVYNRAKDKYVATFMMGQKKYPSWSLITLIIHPETGVVEQRVALTGFAVAHAWTNPVFNGGMNKTFAIYIAYPSSIVEITIDDQIPTASQVANPIVTQTQLPALGATVYGHAVCPERKLVTLLSGTEGIVVYDYSAYPSAATKVSQQPFTELYSWSMGYEDDQRVWMLFANNIWSPSNAPISSLVKYNFWYDRFELVTELQPSPEPDRIAKVAWDTRRKKLCAFRIKADGGGGAARNDIEFYSPRPVMTRISVPVNLSTLATDKTTLMSTTLSGSKGEAGGGGREISLTAVPSAILQVSKAFTRDSGSAEFSVTPTGPYTNYQVDVAYNETKES